MPPKLMLPRSTSTLKQRMLLADTPIEYYKEFNLWVKREDLACHSPGPAFSKTRGVFSHIAKRPESVIGVLDTVHSQAGHAVARACQLLGKDCYNFFPVYKRELTKSGYEVREAQSHASSLGARLEPLTAGRSCILYHAAKKHMAKLNGYLMPNALKLKESVEETAKEVPPDVLKRFDSILIPASSGTIAAGVIAGCLDHHRDGLTLPHFIVHMGYSRSQQELFNYLCEQSGITPQRLIKCLTIIDEGYRYKDQARPGTSPPWPCNAYYDLKAFRWFVDGDRKAYRRTLFWNIG